MSDTKMEHSTVYDDVFRTIIERTPKLMVYLINEVFSESYDPSEKVLLLQNELLSEERKIIADSYVRIGNKHYHVECQSNPDGTMAIRMIEYDFMIALRNAEKDGYDYNIKYPNSCVLYLRHNSNTPECFHVNVELPDGTTFTYKTPIIKVQEYSLKEIFEKKLLALLPYYILRYEKQLNDIELDIDKRRQFVEKYKEIFIKVQNDQELSDYDIAKIKDYILTILDWVVKENINIKKEVHAMCGKVIRTKTDDIYDAGKRDLAIILYKSGMSADMIAEKAQISLETIKQWLSDVAKPAK